MSKTTIKDIEDKLRLNAEKFNASEWKGMLRDDIGSVFANVFKFIPPIKLPYYRLATSLKNKSVYSFFEIQHVVNGILSVEPIDVQENTHLSTEELYEEFIFSLQDTATEWNIIDKKFQAAQQRERETLESFLPQKPRIQSL